MPIFYQQTRDQKATRTQFGKHGKRADLDNIGFRSAWEANIARYLNLLVRQGEILSWEYEVDEFQFPVAHRGNWFYRPDFKVYNRDGSVYYIEVKGYMDKDSKTKLNRMAQYFPKIKVDVIDRDRYNAIAKWKTVIPEWEG